MLSAYQLCSYDIGRSNGISGYLVSTGLFRRLTSCQRDPRNWGVTAIHCQDQGSTPMEVDFNILVDLFL